MHLQKLYTSAAFATALSFAALVPSPAIAAAATGQMPSYLARANDHGHLDASRQIAISVHLKKENEAGFQKALSALYEPGSATYHRWMTDEDLKQYEPSPDKIAAVRKELASHGLTVVSADRHNFTIRARGSVSSVEEAFGTELHEFEHNGKVYRANVKDARLTGPAGDYVSRVAGLESHQAKPLIKFSTDMKTGKPYPAVPFKKVQATGLSYMFTDSAIGAVQSFTLSEPSGAPSDATLATYRGEIYDNGGLPVAFLPSQLQAAYGLPAAYSQQLDGRGQTIILLDAYGYPAAEADANAYFAETGVPLLTASNFKVVYPDGMPLDPTAAADTGWDGEIALDIQSAHVIAPMANIIVVASNGQDDLDFQSAITYIIDNNLGDVISDSWGEDQEYYSGPQESQSFEDLFEVAAAKGISFQFATGDGGTDGLTSPIAADSLPSNAPHVTAVGGTSLIKTTTGFTSLAWGDTLTDLWDTSNGILDPPDNGLIGLIGGSGGGISYYFGKPAWQASLPISGRGVPDVSALADPYTGVPLVLTQYGSQSLLCCAGGTSLASPIFSAFWAIANQNNGGKSLGQAAPIISTLNNYHLFDITPITPKYIVHGEITNPEGTIDYIPPDIVTGAIYSNHGWTSTLWQIKDDSGDLEELLYFAFGLDGALNTAVGWDDVTGYGTPNGLPFLNGAVGK